jgi:hypothetical protein
VEGLGQVVLGNAKLRSQAGRADRLVGALGDGEDRAERVLSGLGQQGLARLKKNSCFQISYVHVKNNIIAGLVASQVGRGKTKPG